MAESSSLLLLTRGQEIECRNPIYRPAILPPALSASKKEAVASSIVANFPRRWKLARGCKVRTPTGEFIVTATPHPDRSILLTGKHLDEIAHALRLQR